MTGVALLAVFAVANRSAAQSSPFNPIRKLTTWHTDRNDLSRDLTTEYERLAAMHAILRALGADYRAAASHREDPYERATRIGGHVGFQDHIDINRLGMFAPNATGETKRSSESHEQTRRFAS